MLSQKGINKNKMLNVFSFQKIITPQTAETKNISKTLHYVLNQPNKRILNQSKASLDFKKILSKHHQAKRHLSKERQEETQIITNPLQETSPSVTNIQSLLYNKAFKIRCYSKRISKQPESENELSTIIILKSKTKIQLEKIPKIKDLPALKQQQKQNIFRMQRYQCSQSLRQIALNLKVHYNKQLKSSQREIPEESTLQQSHSTKISIKKCSIVINVSDLAIKVRMMASKSGQKQKTAQFFVRRVIITLKKTIELKFNCQKQSYSVYDLPQIIFKVSSNEQYNLVKAILVECDFYFFHCLFYAQNKYVQSTSIYDLSQINQIRSNIIILDCVQNFKSHPPFLSGNYRVALCATSDKINLVTTFQKLLESSFILSSISNGFQKFIFTNKKYGQIVEFPLAKLIQKVKQKRNVAQQLKKQQCAKIETQSLHQNNQMQSVPRTGAQSSSLGRFKQKMLMYLKIVQKDSNEDFKKPKLPSLSGHEDFECALGRQQNSKTNIQIVSELIRLNANIQKQIVSYQKEAQNLQFLPDQTQIDEFEHKFSNQMFVNIIA